MKEKEKLEDWEYALRSSIYLTLIGYEESNGKTMPCKVRENIEAKIVSEFRSRLSAYGLKILKENVAP